MASANAPTIVLAVAGGLTTAFVGAYQFSPLLKYQVHHFLGIDVSEGGFRLPNSLAGENSEFQRDHDRQNRKSNADASLPALGAALSPAEKLSLTSAYGRFQTGDYEGAVSLLRAELKTSPDSVEIRENLGTALLALALVRLQQQNLAEAEGYFEESAKLGNPDAERALAALKLKQGQVDLASSLFEEMFDKTNDPKSLQILADISLRQDDLDRAEYFLSRIENKNGREVELTPEQKEFVDDRRKRLEQKKLFAQTQDVIDRGVVEVASFSPEVRPAAEVIADALERVYVDLTGLMGTLPTQTRLRAWVLPTDSFRVSTGAPLWAGALFDGFIRIPVPKGNLSPMAQASLARLARHEATHAYLYAFCGDIVPSWLGEGLAQKYEGRGVSQSLEDLARKGGRTAFDGKQADFLDNPSFTNAPPAAISRLYAQSFVLVNYLTQTQGGEALWQKVLRSSCQIKLPLNAVLEEELGEPNAAALWAKHAEKIKNTAY